MIYPSIIVWGERVRTCRGDIVSGGGYQAQGGGGTGGLFGGSTPTSNTFHVNTYLTHHYLVVESGPVKITPEIETYFLSFTLVFGIDGTPPVSDNRNEKFIMKQRVAETMSQWNNKPDFINKLQRAYVEIGYGRDTNKWFYDHLAEAYLNWLWDKK